MNCSKTQLLIDEIGDLDRLPPEAARHVAACGACERFGDELLRLRALLREPERVPAPTDFDAALARRLRAARATSPRRSAWTWIGAPSHRLATAAALGLVAFGSVTAWNAMNVVQPSPILAPAAVETASAVAPPSVEATSVVPDAAKAPTTVKVVQPPRPVSRPGNVQVAASRVQASPADAMILVSDEAGTRVVSVPTVLVGSQSAVPASVAAATAATADSSVAF